MRKITDERFTNHLKKERLLARVLAEDLRSVRGRELGIPLTSVVTGQIRRDWSDATDDGV